MFIILLPLWIVVLIFLYFCFPKFFNSVLLILVLLFVIFLISIPIKNASYSEGKENAKFEESKIVTENVENTIFGKKYKKHLDKNFPYQKIINKGEDYNLLTLTQYDAYFFSGRDSINDFDADKGDLIVKLHFSIDVEKPYTTNIFLPTLLVNGEKYYKVNMTDFYSFEITYLENKEIVLYSEDSKNFVMFYALPNDTTEFTIMINEEEFGTITLPTDIVNKKYTEYNCVYCDKEYLLNDNGSEGNYAYFVYKAEQFDNWDKYIHKNIYEIISYEAHEEFKYIPKYIWDDVTEESKVAFSELAPVDYRY